MALTLNARCVERFDQRKHSMAEFCKEIRGLVSLVHRLGLWTFKLENFQIFGARCLDALLITLQTLENSFIIKALN